MQVTKDDKISIALKIGERYIDSKGREAKEPNWISCEEWDWLNPIYEDINGKRVEIVKWEHSRFEFHDIGKGIQGLKEV